MKGDQAYPGTTKVVCYRCAGEMIIDGKPCKRCGGTGVDPNP